jgi:hypothetical protein
LTHRLTTTLATLIGSAAQAQEYEPVAEAIEAATDGYTADRKADLYALIQDSVNKDMSFNELQDAVDKALRSNDRRFHLG